MLIVVLVVGYKVYLDVFDTEFRSVHADQVERIQKSLAGRHAFRFAVVGNVNNSIGVFERQILPRINASGADFLISAGNAVSDGGEDKYRALRGTLRRLEIPYVLTFGEQEEEGLGGYRFYRHYGPYFFAFTAGSARFIFLDTTGQSSYAWQLRWLEEELASGDLDRTFLFTGRPILRPRNEPAFADEEDDLVPDPFRRRLLDLVERHGVDAVFADNVSVYDHQVQGGTEFVTTGGAGGLVVGDEVSFHHYASVEVSPDGISVRAERLDVGQHPVWRTLESFWLLIHSIFFVGYLNFVLLLALLVLVAMKLHGLIFVERDYYPSFDLDPEPFLRAPLRVVMFTNNYLPFIGGVPISIERLRRGLVELGKHVLIVAPRYGGTDDGEPDPDGGVLRVPSILSLGKDDEFRLANLFLPRTVRRVKDFDPDVVHLHHPFWLGSLGLWLARWLGAPAIYTYHTRFEHYAHYVPVPGRLVRNLISHFLIRRFANKCHGVVVPTPSAREYLRTIGVKSRIVVQPTGIDCGAFQDVEPTAVEALRRRLGVGDEPVLISVSRLSEEKNIDFLIDGVAALARDVDVPFRFVLVGEGDDRARIEERIEALGLADTAILTGGVPAEQMPLHYHLGDAFLFASTTETQGMVVLEAMAAGLPVVAVRSSGVDDLVRDGFNGFKTREDRHEWTARARELLLDEELRVRLGRNARSFAQDHDVERFAREILGFYAMALASEEEGRSDGG